MSGIDDLRRTLEDRATGLAPDDSSARRTAVHRRIGVVRRRRQVGVAGAAAAVVAIGAGVALLPGDGSTDAIAPATQTVFGQEVPATIDVLGFTYRLDEVVAGEGSRAHVELGASDLPRVVTWATESTDQRVTVADPVDHDVIEDARYATPDLEDWHGLPTGIDLSFDVRATASDVAAAVYVLDPGAPRPAGATSGGATFRDRAPGLTLDDAVVGAPGQARVTVDTDLAGTTGRLYAFCSGGPADAVVDYAVTSTDGSVQTGGSCGGAVPVDVLSEVTAQELTVSSGAVVTVTIQDGSGRIVEDDDLVVGLGVYEPDTAGGPVPDTYEAFSHQWRLVSSDTAPSSLTSWTTLVPDAAGLPVLAVTLAELGENSEVEISARAEGSSPTSFSGGSGFTSVALVGPGDEIGYDVASGLLEPDDRITVGYYVRAD